MQSLQDRIKKEFIDKCTKNAEESRTKTMKSAYLQYMEKMRKGELQGYQSTWAADTFAYAALMANCPMDQYGTQFELVFGEKTYDVRNHH